MPLAPRCSKRARNESVGSDREDDHGPIDRAGWDSSLALGTAGALLVALAIFASLAYRNGFVRRIGGRGWHGAVRQAALGRWRGTIIIFDALAFAIFAVQRNDYLAFWQLVGPWSDVARFNFAGASIAYAVYIIGTLFVIASEHRAPRPIEAIGLIGIPFVLNLIVVLGADWHMAEIWRLRNPARVAAVSLAGFHRPDLDPVRHFRGDPRASPL